MTNPPPNAAAVVIFLGCTAAMLVFTFVWATAGRRNTPPHRQVTGRAAQPYWHSPTGLQDERGITARARRA
jgi:hypothetical protein